MQTPRFAAKGSCCEKRSICTIPIAISLLFQISNRVNSTLPNLSQISFSCLFVEGGVLAQNHLLQIVDQRVDQRKKKLVKSGGQLPFTTTYSSKKRLQDPSNKMILQTRFLAGVAQFDRQFWQQSSILGRLLLDAFGRFWMRSIAVKPEIDTLIILPLPLAADVNSTCLIHHGFPFQASFWRRRFLAQAEYLVFRNWLRSNW